MKSYNQLCNVAKTLDIIGDRWTLLIIRELLKGNCKFNDIKQELQGIAPNMLSDRLQVLESEGVLTIEMYSKHPPRFSYELTQKGFDLRHVIHALALWGNQYMDVTYAKVVHKTCGHEVQPHYYCKTCSTGTDEIMYVPV